MTDNWLEEIEYIEQEFPEKPAQRSLRDGSTHKEVRDSINKRKYNRTYYNKNKDTLNERRKQRARTVRGAFLNSRTRARSRGEDWVITEEEWTRLWEECPEVWDTDRKLYRKAFYMRGRSPYQSTQVCRKDTSLPWSYDNMEIRYKLQPVPADGVVGDWDYVNGCAKPLKVEEIL
jgi:hypothetical protein